MAYVASFRKTPSDAIHGLGADSPATVEPLDAKRFGELLLAFLILFVVAPVLLIVALMIWTEDGGPVFFSQSRIGRDGKHFRCLKLRTMSVDASTKLARLLETSEDARTEWARDYKLRNDPRITRLGGFLRKTSLDEVPQLLNVIRGDMSLVGPRPIVDAEVVRYGRRFEAYCRVRPGITGLWQVKGRNDVSYRRRVAIDTIYCANKSLGLDLRIVAATVPVVLFRRGSY